MNKALCMTRLILSAALLLQPLSSFAISPTTNWNDLLQVLGQDLSTNPLSSKNTEGPPLTRREDFQNFYWTTFKEGEYSHYSRWIDPELIADAMVKGMKDPAGFNPSYVEALEVTRKFKNEGDFFATIRQPSHPINGDPWTFSKFPSYEVRKIGYDQVLEGEPLKNFLTEESAKALAGKVGRIKFLQDPSATFQAMGEKSLPLILDGAKSDAVPTGIAASRKMKWLACLRFSFTSAKSCVKALDEIWKIMAPTEALTAIPILRKIIEDPSYADGAARAAQKIMARIENGNPSSGDVGDLFNDLRSSYLELGMSPALAESKTWDLLAVYGARGSNIKMLFPYASGKPGARTLIALDVITSGAGVLDSMVHQTGHLYSLPKEITTVALYGKPYHFWMSAYLSNTLTQQLGNKSGVEGAVAIAELGYQMFSTTAGREGFFQTILSEDLYSVEANKTRIDLAFGFAGSSYGAAAASGQTAEMQIDIDYTVKKMLENASGTSRWSIEKADQLFKDPVGKFLAYKRWLDRITPFRGLRLIRSQAGCSRWLRGSPAAPFALRID